MEQILQKTLRDNEKVLWFGRPTKTKLLRSPDRVSQYVAWIITAVMTLFSFGVFLPFAIADNKSIGIILIGLVPMIGIPLAVAVRPYLDKKLLEQKTIYAITDQRIIAVVKSNVMTMPRDQKVTCAVECRDGRKCLSMRSESVSLADDTKRVTDVKTELFETVELTSDVVYLRIDGDFRPGRDIASFSYSYDNSSWTPIGKEYRMIFDYRRFFMGTKFAIFNYATRQTGGYVDVDFFDYERIRDVE